ncbi:uncharacterized protein LOC127240931 isoform X2 [Andrographis paniculata]|uniref:uncharacterized protein LOC127240931 isoform X2 n=1 Tax=Andrographis paniculata TaxID=175694 RepID=UPI0021E892DF|nr:uncharacterized protein LOC127240931 isoform X2 [Andrographis paniculata]
MVGRKQVSLSATTESKRNENFPVKYTRQNSRRKPKKMKHLDKLVLPQVEIRETQEKFSNQQCGIDSNSEKACGKRKTSTTIAVDCGSDDDAVTQKKKEKKQKKVLVIEETTKQDSGAGTSRTESECCATSTPLPDKKLLAAIFIKLQEKDAYRLPDYYDVVKQPIDFATIRKKLRKTVTSVWRTWRLTISCYVAMQYCTTKLILSTISRPLP